MKFLKLALSFKCKDICFRYFFKIKFVKYVLFEKYYKGLFPVYFARPSANSNLTSPFQNLPLNSSH